MLCFINSFCIAYDILSKARRTAINNVVHKKCCYRPVRNHRWTYLPLGNAARTLRCGHIALNAVTTVAKHVNLTTDALIREIDRKKMEYAHNCICIYFLY